MNFFTGKKTYIGAAILALAACAGYYVGSFDGPTTTLFLGTALTAAGLGSKVQRYAPAILASLQEIKKVQEDVAAGKKVNVAGEALKVGEIAIGAELGTALPLKK